MGSEIFEEPGYKKTADSYGKILDYKFPLPQEKIDFTKLIEHFFIENMWIQYRPYYKKAFNHCFQSIIKEKKQTIRDIKRMLREINIELRGLKQQEEQKYLNIYLFALMKIISKTNTKFDVGESVEEDFTQHCSSRVIKTKVIQTEAWVPEAFAISELVYEGNSDGRIIKNDFLRVEELLNVGTPYPDGTGVGSKNANSQLPLLVIDPRYLEQLKH